jgi:hypothetical protein
VKVHLQGWYDRWLKDPNNTNRRYVPVDSRGEPSLHQLHFVRDTLCGMLWADVPYDKRETEAIRENCKVTAFVIGEHTSKSVQLPVYSLERPDLGLQIVLRDNYHDVNLSVISENPIDEDTLRGFELDYGRDEDRKRFPNGYKPGQSWGYCYFQGFPEEVQFGPYSEDPRKFSLCIGSEYSVYTFMWLIMREVRGVGPWAR